MDNFDIALENISFKTDKTFVIQMLKAVSNMFDTFRLTLEDAGVSFNERDMSYRNYDIMKKKLRDTIINKELKKIEEIVSNRFGFDIKLVNHYLTYSVAYVVTPMLDYKTINMAIEDLDSLFPKKSVSSVLWNLAASTDEQRTYKTLKSIVDALKKGDFAIDIEKGYVKGLDNAEFVIHIDIIYAMINNLTPEEFVAVLLHEIGHIFTYLEHIFYSTKNTIVLLENFMYERFDKGKGGIEAISIALEDTGVRVKNKNAIGVLQGLDMFMLKVYKVDTKKGILNIDFERLADQFATRFGLGDALASALVKLSSKGTIGKDVEEKGLGEKFIKFIKLMIIFITSLLAILIFNVFGIVVLILIFGFKIITFVMGMIIKLVQTIFRTFFNDLEQNELYDDIEKRLRKIRTELVRELRLLGNDKVTKPIILQQIEGVDTSIKLINERWSILKKYGDTIGNINTTDNREIVNEMMEMLEDNEHYVLSEKFKRLLKND